MNNEIKDLLIRIYTQNRAFLRTKLSNKNKVFCIGKNKTGTTSVKQALKDLGYVIGHQRKAERLLEDYKIRNFKGIIKYCKTAEAFQDIPFSLPYTYVILDHAFPNSKFILTVRDNAEEWYESYIRHQKEVFNTGEKLPSPDQLKKSTYVYKGWSYDVKKALHPISDDNLYSKNILKKSYTKHNQDVKDYFRFRQKDFLVLNLKDPNAYFSLCNFLNREPMYDQMPWLNKTEK